MKMYHSSNIRDDLYIILLTCFQLGQRGVRTLRKNRGPDLFQTFRHIRIVIDSDDDFIDIPDALYNLLALV